MGSQDRKRAYWRRTLRITGLLLALWFGVTVGLGYFARELQFRFFGWPFGFWAAAQGAVVVYVLIIAVYAWAMNRLDRQHRDDAPRGEGGDAA